MPRLQIVISEESDKLLRENIHRKGDLSAIIDQLIKEKFGSKPT